MNGRTSVSVSADLAKAIDEFAGKSKNRSRFIDQVIREYIAQKTRERQSAHDLEIIRQHADRLNREALDVLEYQGDV